MAVSQEFSFYRAEIFPSILDAARQDQRTNLGVLLDVYRGFLLSNASKKLSHDIVAKVAPSDLVQETLMQAARCFDQFHGSSEFELRTWLSRILQRKMLDTHRYFHDYAVRDICREVPFLDEPLRKNVTLDEEFNQIAAVEKTEKMAILTELLGKLKEEERKAIQLRTFDRLSFEEVGKQLCRSTEAARKIWTRAIQKMSREFQNRATGA